jgi:hypothetical protein
MWCQLLERLVRLECFTIKYKASCSEALICLRNIGGGQSLVSDARCLCSSTLPTKMPVYCRCTTASKLSNEGSAALHCVKDQNNSRTEKVNLIYKSECVCVCMYVQD